jgi:hypothetical protein
MQPKNDGIKKTGQKWLIAFHFFKKTFLSPLLFQKHKTIVINYLKSVFQVVTLL